MGASCCHNRPLVHLLQSSLPLSFALSASPSAWCILMYGNLAWHVDVDSIRVDPPDSCQTLHPISVALTSHWARSPDCWAPMAFYWRRQIGPLSKTRPFAPYRNLSPLRRRSLVVTDTISPFTFLRGTPHIAWKDMSPFPISTFPTQLFPVTVIALYQSTSLSQGLTEEVADICYLSLFTVQMCCLLRGDHRWDGAVTSQWTSDAIRCDLLWTTRSCQLS